MNVKEYRLTFSEEPTDEMLHEIMSQVAETACQSTRNAHRVLQDKMQETIILVRMKRKNSAERMC